MSACGWLRNRLATLIIAEAFIQAFRESGLPRHDHGKCPTLDCPCDQMTDQIEARAIELAAARLGVSPDDLR